MSESIEIQMVNNKAATISVTRKVSIKQYESLEVGLFLPVELPVRSEDDSLLSYQIAVGEAVRQGINVAKVQVYDALGLEYTDNNGIIAEKIAAKIEGSTVAPRGNFRPVPNQPSDAPAAPAGETASTNGAPGGAGVVCPKCKGAMWDNRQSKTNPKQPDFKCKDRDNCDGVVWPERKRG